MGLDDRIFAHRRNRYACSRVFLIKVALESNGCILTANSETSYKSGSETTTHIRICDQRGVASPTR
jgi:hypothetical protein